MGDRFAASLPAFARALQEDDRRVARDHLILRGGDAKTLPNIALAPPAIRFHTHHPTPITKTH